MQREKKGRKQLQDIWVGDRVGRRWPKDKCMGVGGGGGLLGGGGMA